jgi:hypothetical protein
MSGQGPARLERAPLLAFAWLWVGVPFGYGVYELVHKIHALFSS